MAPHNSAGPTAQPDAATSSITDSTSAVVSLLQATKSLVTSLTLAGSEFDLTCDDVLVLDALARQGSASMAELSARAATSGATLTRSVDRLVSHALVYREVSAEDRRRVKVHLSARGAAIHQELEPQLANLNSEASRILGNTGMGTN